MNQPAQDARQGLSRRSFLGMALAGCVACAGLPATPSRTVRATEVAAASDAATEALSPLPPAEPDPDDEFGVDVSVNMSTIDAYLGRPDVTYRDMRLIFDPARWEDVGEDPYASRVLPGFKLVPYPYLATMAPIPVTEHYGGDTLFTCTWSDEGELLGVKGNYRESMTVLRELFPQDKPLFLCCGGAGYASFTKQLLLYLGWDETLVYNVGGMWYYEGSQAIDLIERGADPDDDTYATWRADYALIDFTLLRPKSVNYQDHRAGKD